MRRWNGWGEEGRDEPLDAQALAFLGERIGPGVPPRDAELADVLAALPTSRVAASGFSADPELRLRCARGQSYPDWLALRFGCPGPVADAVALPESHEQAAAALAVARRLGAAVIPHGGGTSVVGHLQVPAGERPVVNISLQRLDRLLEVDRVACLARFGAGASGPRLESQLAQHGLVLGHFPQSWEYSTLGGWVVTRSCGQQSLRYGRIEQLFYGGRLATPRGEWRVGGHPASSAGPDLRECVLGSEGRLGLLTEATVRVRQLPPCEDFHALFFADWERGLEAVRQLAQADIGLSMLRLSNAAETETQLRLSGHRRVSWLRRYLALRGLGVQPVLLMMGVTGGSREVSRARRAALALTRPLGAVHLGRGLGRAWTAKRFAGPYLRNSLWASGYGVDTVETCTTWPRATALMQAMERAAHSALAEFGERVHAFTHASHVYRQGCSLYATFVFRAVPDYQENLERWRRMKTAVSQAIVDASATISHQHGVGLDHAPYLPAEKSGVGMDLLRAIAATMDPEGIMNPGKLFA